MSALMFATRGLLLWEQQYGHVKQITILMGPTLHAKVALCASSKLLKLHHSCADTNGCSETPCDAAATCLDTAAPLTGR
jgi:hypothetical protein